MFAVEVYKTEGINTHISAYLIIHTSVKSVILLSSLVCKQVAYSHSYPGDSHSYVALKSNVPYNL